MKRAFVPLLLGSFIALAAPVRAADTVALAAQQELIESFKRLNATVEELTTTQAAHSKQIAELRAELGKVRDDMVRNNNDAVMKERLNNLHEQITKVDKTRAADNERVLEAMKQLGETVKKVSLAPPPKRPVISDTTALGGNNFAAKPLSRGGANGGAVTPSTEEGWEYEVVSGDHPGRIAAKYQAEKINVTATAIKNANPGVDWAKLKVGQKLFIPKPKS